MFIFMKQQLCTYLQSKQNVQSYANYNAHYDQKAIQNK